MKFSSLLFVICVSQVISCFSQPSIGSDVDYYELACPETSIRYFINYPSGYIKCSIAWSIASGLGNLTSSSSPTDDQIHVLWRDQKPNKVVMRAVVTYHTNATTCTSGSESVTLTFTHILRTAFGETPDAITRPAISYCGGNIALHVSPMYIQNTGGFEPVPLTEVLYKWTIPAGWKSDTNVQGPASFITTVSSLVLVPLNNCSEGTVSVYGSTNSICGSSSDSYPSSNILTRTPAFLVTNLNGYNNTATYGNNTPVTFTVPAISCATSYSWTKPSGWTGSSTTNSITLTPSGCSNADAGNIVATANMGSCTISSPAVHITYVEPTNIYVAGEGLLCYNGGSYNVVNSPSTISYNWSVSPANMFVTSSGTGKTANLTPISTANGFATITFTPPCGATISAQFWIGPSTGIVNFENSIPEYYSTSEYYKFAPYPVGYFNDGTYSVTGGYITNIGAGDYVWVQFTVFNDYATITWYPGSTDCHQVEMTTSVLVGSDGCPPGDICPNVVYPNPSNELLKISMTQPPSEKRPIETSLYNSNSNLVHKEIFTGKDFQISVKNLPNGIYYLHLKRGDKKVQRRIEIKH